MWLCDCMWMYVSVCACMCVYVGVCACMWVFIYFFHFPKETNWKLPVFWAMVSVTKAQLINVVGFFFIANAKRPQHFKFSNFLQYPKYIYFAYFFCLFCICSSFWFLHIVDCVSIWSPVFDYFCLFCRRNGQSNRIRETCEIGGFFKVCVRFAFAKKTPNWFAMNTQWKQRFNFFQMK